MTRRGAASGLAALALALAWTGPARAGGDTTPPETTLTAGPSGVSTNPTPTFEFVADEPATFECRLDDAAFAPCSSPYTTPPLGLAAHRFEVRAIDSAGNVDPTPAARAWSVTTLRPPSVVITAPSGPVAAARLTAIRGTAASPLGVARVRVALRRFGKRTSDTEAPRCRFVSLRTGRLVDRPCVLPLFRRADGTEHWAVALPRAARRRLAPGRYEVEVRAADSNGQIAVLRRTVVLTA